MIRKINIILLIIMMCGSQQIWAAIRFTPMTHDFTTQSPRRFDATLSNSGNRTEYINMKTVKIVRVKKNSYKNVTIKNPIQDGLVISPNRLVLQPNQKRIIRISYIKPYPKFDQYYQISGSPVPPKLIPNDNNSKNKIQAGLQISIIYALSVTVRPEHLYPIVAIKVQHKTLLITNKGNTKVKLINGKQCHLKNCYALKSKVVFPQSSIKIPLKYQDPVEYTVTYPGKLYKIKSNG